MKNLGLFIGIDRYLSTGINTLNCAKKDATALYSIFTDTLGGENKLLVDEEATKLAIQEELNRLAKCDPDDTVFITFSGHGSETHELVTYDADRADLPQSCIPLGELLDSFSKIPAKRLILVLDCCFSGGMGSKVLKVDNLPRSLESSEDLISRFAGEGRLILTASSAIEPAWENQKLSHGFLTYHLISGLMGAEEVRSGGKVGIYRLLEYVTQKVVDSAIKIGKPQHPSVKGSIDEELVLPIFIKGQTYLKYFPEYSSVKISPEIESLSQYGFPTDLLQKWAKNIPRLNQLQVDAVNEFNVLNGDHLVVSAPTSSGKTMIGELAALKGSLERKKTAFLFPLRALVHDKQKYFTNTYGEFGLKVIQATGETSTDDTISILKGQYDIALFTYEKFSALALGYPHVLDQLGLVIIDEAQMISDKSRGANLEFLLTLLKVRRLQGVEPQTITLSAVIGDTNGFERWFDARLLRREERPVPLDEGLITGSGDLHYIDSSKEKKSIDSYIIPEGDKTSSQKVIIPLVKKLVSEGKQVIVFRSTKGDARGCANYLANALNLPPAEAALEQLINDDPSESSRILRNTLSKGVAFHVSDLDRNERLVIEEEFRAANSKIRVIAATTTLAMGVNTPAEAVVIAGLTHQPGNVPYSVAEYKNMIGRAGRLGHSEHGQSFLVALSMSEVSNNWAQYVLGQPESIQSRFLTKNTDVRSMILRILAASIKSSKRGLSSEDIVSFLEESFGAFQKKVENETWRLERHTIEQALGDLRNHNMITSDESGINTLTKLGWLAGHSGIEVESVIRVIDALNGLDSTQFTDPALIVLSQLTVELDQVGFPINKKSTEQEPRTWRTHLNGQGISGRIINSLNNWVSETYQPTLRAKKAVAALFWITDTPMSNIEKTMIQHGGGSDVAAGAIRNVASRINDVLMVIGKVIEIIYPDADLSQRLERLAIRLNLGISASIVEVAKYAGDSMARPDYQKLIKAGLTDEEKLVKFTDDQFLQMFNNDQNKVDAIKRVVILMKEAKLSTQEIIDSLPPYEG